MNEKKAVKACPRRENWRSFGRCYIDEGKKTDEEAAPSLEASSSYYRSTMDQQPIDMIICC